MTPFRYALVGYVLLFLWLYAFFKYLQPTVAAWLLWTGLACVVPFVVVSLVVLFRGDGKSRAIFLVSWLCILLLIFTPIGSLGMQLIVLGFRLHVWNVENYVATTCELVDFSEGGKMHSVGRCDAFDDRFGGDLIFYDSSGEIAIPLSRRSSEWKDAMYYFPPKKVLRDGEDRAQHLFGNFYVVRISDDELDGDGAVLLSRKNPPDR